MIDQRAVFFNPVVFTSSNLAALGKTPQLNNLCKSILWSQRTRLSNALGDAGFKRIAHPERCAKGDLFKTSPSTEAEPSWHLANAVFAAKHV